LRIAFITNICAHYRVKTFETLSRYYHIDYYFFSAGDEWYWQQEHGVRAGNFHYEYLPGFRLGRTRVTPTLPWKLWRGNYDVYIKCITGRFALPITYLIARLRRKPFILWTGIWMRLQTPFHRLAWPLTRYIYHHADAIVVYGEHVKRYLMSEGVLGERIFVAAHAVDNEAYNRPVSEEEKQALRRQLNISPDKKVVLYLGRLSPEKGVEVLLDAVTGLPDLKVKIAGDGPRFGALQAIARQRGLQQVEFLGRVAGDEKWELLRNATAVVIPSVWYETFSFAALESMGVGTPVLASDLGSLPYVVEDGKSGLLFRAGDSQDLREKLAWLVQHPSEALQMGCYGRQSVEARYSASAHYEDLMRIYQEFVKR